MDSLVEAGTITEDQEKAIRNALETSRMANMSQSGSNSSEDPLGNLVKSGTITDDQKNAVKDALDSSRKANGMPPPPPPPPAGQDGNGSLMTNTFDSLVTDGTITSDQEKKILTTLQSTFQSSNSNDNTESDPLDSLVSNGTITNDQEKAVKSAFESAIKAYSAQAYSYEDTNENSNENSIDIGM